jgi:hypothetical protein
MRGYNKKYVKCLLVEPLTPALSPLMSRSSLAKNIEVGMPHSGRGEGDI